MDITIRPGGVHDLAAAHRLVGELAEFEKAAEHFTATLEDYQNDFSDDFFHFLVAETGGKVVGLALYYYVYSTWKGRMVYLEDFVVDPTYRSRGIGAQLWAELKQKGRERGCKLLKWQVLDWNTEAIRFYRDQQATIEDEWLNGKLTL